MHIRSAWVLVLFGLVVRLPAQTPVLRNQNNVAAHEHFFQHVIDILNHHFFVGNPPTTPPLQRAFPNVVLTDQEAELLKTLAADYETKNAAFLALAGPLRMEARFQSIELGHVSEQLAQQIMDLDVKHNQMVTGLINRLKDAFSPSRLEVLNTLVRGNL